MYLHVGLHGGLLDTVRADFRADFRVGLLNMLFHELHTFLPFLYGVDKMVYQP